MPPRFKRFHGGRSGIGILPPGAPPGLSISKPALPISRLSLEMRERHDLYLAATNAINDLIGNAREEGSAACWRWRAAKLPETPQSARAHARLPTEAGWLARIVHGLRAPWLDLCSSGPFRSSPIRPVLAPVSKVLAETNLCAIIARSRE